MLAKKKKTFMNYAQVFNSNIQQFPTRTILFLNLNIHY